MSEGQTLDVLFLGTAGCHAPADEDTASYLVADELLIDTGWQLRDRLKRFGRDPLAYQHLCLTHLHHDHMMGLPTFLYNHAAAGSLGELHLYGPPGLDKLVEQALALMDADVYWPNLKRPQIRQLRPGEGFETPRLEVSTMASLHPVPGLCYRIRDRQSGLSLGFGGDGAWQDELISFFAGCQALVLEHSLGLRKPEQNPHLHMDIIEASTLAREAGAAILCPVHGPAAQREACHQAAQRLFAGRIVWPRSGQVLKLGASG